MNQKNCPHTTLECVDCEKEFDSRYNRLLWASIAARETELAAMRFGLAVLEESRREFGDVDGGWIQDEAEKLGLLARVVVTERCGDNCFCAEFGDFPQECLRYCDAAESLLAQLSDLMKETKMKTAKEIAQGESK